MSFPHVFSGSVSKDASKPLCPVCVGVEADDSFDKIEETRALLDETKFGTNPCRDAVFASLQNANTLHLSFAAISSVTMVWRITRMDVVGYAAAPKADRSS